MRPNKCTGCDYVTRRIEATGMCKVKAYLYCQSFGKPIKHIHACKFGPYHERYNEPN